VQLIFIEMYKRKTKEKYYVGLKVGFDGKEQIMTWDFKDESECNQKLKDLWRKVEESRKNPVLDPFSQFNRWYKIIKRVPI